MSNRREKLLEVLRTEQSEIEDSIVEVKNTQEALQARLEAQTEDLAALREDLKSVMALIKVLGGKPKPKPKPPSRRSSGLPSGSASPNRGLADAALKYLNSRSTPCFADTIMSHITAKFPQVTRTIMGSCLSSMAKRGQILRVRAAKPRNGQRTLYKRKEVEHGQKVEELRVQRFGQESNLPLE